MSFTSNDYKQLQMLRSESPENDALIQKLLDSHHYTISKISHELRNPLALIYSTYQLIQSQHPEVRDFKYWDAMGMDLEFMKGLLEELSAYNNGETLHMETFSSEAFLQKLCLSFAASCVDTDIEFASLISPDLPEITADPVKLREVILNLLKNAKDAISSHGVIRLEASLTDQMLCIRVIDNGCGISSEHLETLFDAFVTHKPSGTGLGLSISEKIVEAHQGNISVSSSPSKGTSFLVQLPIRQLCN